MGVYRRGKIWYIRYQGPDGRIYRESTEQESKELAKKILAKRKTEIAEEKFLDRIERPEMTLPELCDWYWHHHGRHLKWNGVQGVLERFKASFGRRRLVAITPELVSEYAEHRRTTDKVKPRTVNRDLQLLKSMFNLIFRYKRWKKVLENPVSYVKQTRENNLRVRYLDQEQIRRLLASCREHLRPIVVLGVRTGMRRGEIFRLRWSGVDLDERRIFVRQSKNGESRYVPISDDLAGELARLDSRTAGGHVFPSFLPRRGSPKPNGNGKTRRSQTEKASEPSNERAGKSSRNTTSEPSRKTTSELSGERGSEPFVDVKNSWKAALEAARITDFQFHDLRHTFASHLVMQGVDLNTVRELLGHKSLQMTLRYAHLSPGHHRAAISQIDQALGPIERKPGGTPRATSRRFRPSVGCKPFESA